MRELNRVGRVSELGRWEFRSTLLLANPVTLGKQLPVPHWFPYCLRKERGPHRSDPLGWTLPWWVCDLSISPRFSQGRMWKLYKSEDTIGMEGIAITMFISLSILRTQSGRKRLWSQQDNSVPWSAPLRPRDTSRLLTPLNFNFLICKIRMINLGFTGVFQGSN